MKSLFCVVLHLFLLPVCAGTELHILCTSDLHGHFEKLPALAAVMKTVRGPVLKIDTGDTLTGTLYSDFRGGEPMIRLLNHLRFDVWVPGNHDFETGYEAFSARVREFGGVTLGAHWRWKDVVPVKWKLFEINGIRAAVIGATDPSMPLRVLPGTDGEFGDVTKSIGRIMPEILASRPHVIILAFHNGLYSRYARLSDLLRTHPEIDLVFGGHSHKEIAGRKLRHAYLVQAGCHGSCAAHVTVRTDPKSGRIIRIESELLYPDDRIRDAGTEALCGEFSRKQRELASRRVAETAMLCAWPKPREKSSELGNFYAASLMRAAKADAAFVSLPTDRGAGPEKRGRHTLTEGELYRLFPFRNRICTVLLTKEDLPELEAFIRNCAKKRKRRCFFAGDITSDANGALGMKTEKCVLAVSDFTLVSTPVLRSKLDSPGLWKIAAGLLERDVLRDSFRRAEKRLSAPLPQKIQRGEQSFGRQY
ncbi:MAG: bifunctional metallophosphatase/5'-nucleotidase [Lentisphaeria bacterium]|nr:bifunctional metallophosphatase/5'-nucleotidase [Lentisphaeria bacterium]